MHDVYDGGHETLTIKEAAERLGISEQAVRQRIRRKTLPAQKLDGKLYVVLSAGYDDDSPSQHGGHHGERNPVASTVHNVYTDLVSQLRSENELLRQQLTVKDDQIRANQVLLSQLTNQLRSLPETAQDEPVQREQAPEETPVPVTPRPWWRFWDASS